MMRPRFGFHLILFALGLCWFGLSVQLASAQIRTLPGGLQVENLSAPFSPHWESGGGELRYRLNNLSSNEIDRVTLTYPPGSGSNGLRNIRRSVGPIPAGESRIVSLPIPDMDFYTGSTVGVQWGGKSRTVVAPDRGYRRGATVPSVLVSHSLSNRNLQSMLSSGAKSGSDFDQGVVKHEVGMGEWSGNWVAYTQFDAIVISTRDYDNLPAPAKDAVHRYTEMGGCLTVAGADPQLPAHWEAIEPLPRSTKDIRRARAGLGQVLLLGGSGKINDIKSKTWQNAANFGWMPRRAASRAIGEGNLSTAAKVVDDLDIPVLGLFLLMFIFAILIGPINLWYLNRRKKRIWMLWTVPLISAITCGVVFLYSLVSEGIRPTRSSVSYTLLDQQSGHACTLGAVGVYSPLTPSKGFHFDYDTDVHPVTSSDMNGEIVAGADQHYTRGWALARVPIYFQMRRSHISKLRLEVVSVDPAGVEVVNGFGSDIETIWLSDMQGNVFTGSDIAAGAKVTLAKQLGGPGATVNAKAKNGRFATGFTNSDISRLGTLNKPAQFKTFADKHLGLGSYLLTLDANPMLPDVSKGQTRTEHAIIHGTYVQPGGAP